MTVVLQALRVVAKDTGRPVPVGAVLDELRRRRQGPTNRLATFAALEDLTVADLAWRYTDPEGLAVYWPAPVVDVFDEGEVTQPDLRRQVPVD